MHLRCHMDGQHQKRGYFRTHLLFSYHKTMRLRYLGLIWRLSQWSLQKIIPCSELTSGTQVLVDSFQRCCKIRSTTPQIISSDWETCVGIIVRRAVHSFAMFPWNSTHTVLLKAIVLSRMASATGDNFRNLTNFYCFVGMATILFTVYRVPIHNSQMTLGIDSITFAQVSKFFTWNRKWDLLLSSLIDSSVHHWPIHCSVIYLKIIFY